MNKIIIQGILYDKKSSFQEGASLAPPLIRAVMNDGSTNSYSENGISLEDLNIHDKGDFAINEYFDIEEVTRKNLANGDRLLTLGGDHSITYPIIKAFAE